jgi:hypothetical protein
MAIRPHINGEIPLILPLVKGEIFYLDSPDFLRSYGMPYEDMNRHGSAAGMTKRWGSSRDKTVNLDPAYLPFLICYPWFRLRRYLSEKVGVARRGRKAMNHSSRPPSFGRC